MRSIQRHCANAYKSNLAHIALYRNMSSFLEIVWDEYFSASN